MDRSCTELAPVTATDTFGPAMRIVLLVVLLSSFIRLAAQDGTPDPRVFQRWEDGKTAPVDTPQTAPGTVNIHQSEKISALMEDYASHKQALKGYRVQIFLGDRAKAEDIRRAFLGRHPDVPAYLSYLAPNFRVRVGDLRDRVPAEKLREDLKEEYPGLYVVPDEIELPRLVEVEGK
jgi:hypothetical protein